MATGFCLLYNCVEPAGFSSEGEGREGGGLACFRIREFV